MLPSSFLASRALSKPDLPQSLYPMSSNWSSSRDPPNPLPRKKAMVGEEKGLGPVCVSQGERLPVPLGLYLPISSQGSEPHKAPLSGHKQVPPSLSKRDPQPHVPINKRGEICKHIFWTTLQSRRNHSWTRVSRRCRQHYWSARAGLVQGSPAKRSNPRS